MNLRPATMDDAALLRQWANDPAVRAASFKSAPIGFAEHYVWLCKRLPAGGFYIAEHDGIPIGYARVDIKGRVGEISFSLDERYRGNGFGTSLVQMASYRATKELGLEFVRARTKAGNKPSLRTLAAAGFHTEIPHSRPAGGQLVDGPATAGLERRWCELTGMSAAAAVGSGTAALRLALLALGVGPGDEVIVPAYSCVALLNAPLSVGAVPVLADVEPGRWTLDPEDVLRRASDRTAAIIAVNLFGVPADIAELPGTIPVIEDCSHGPILGRTDVSVSSFYATKLVGGDMGGIVTGSWASAFVRGHRESGDRPPDSRNLNDKITEHSASLAVDALSALPETLAERERLAANYTIALEGVVSLPNATEGRVWYRYACELPEGLRAADIISKMKACGVHAEQPVWDLRGCRYWRDDLPVASEAFERLVSLPLYPGLTEAEQRRVIEVFEEATR